MWLTAQPGIKKVGAQNSPALSSFSKYLKTLPHIDRLPTALTLRQALSPSRARRHRANAPGN